MQQVLFRIPFTDGWFPPNGVPVYGFGAMLFLTFVVIAMIWGPRRCEKVGMPRERVQDLAITLFLAGIAGARLLYMVQYRDQFAWDNPARLVGQFFQIWNGGIVFYGSLAGGLLGYIVFHRLVLRKFGISVWKMCDAVAPLIAVGLAIGRLGCYLNGCCWGQPVCVECQPVPLSEVAPGLGQFPLLPAHSRHQVTTPARAADRLPQIHGLQTSAGFSIAPRVPVGDADPRSVVAAVEPGSAAAAAGLSPGDRVVGVNGGPNLITVEVGADVRTFATLEEYRAADLPPGATAHDTLWELGRDWPRGVNELSLVVDRGGTEVALAFVPRTVAFYPTQLYETVSMVLLIGLLLSFQPFRRHDGQVMVLFMLGYAAHRFFNEAIRIEPTYALGLTLSQWISIGMAVGAVVLELFLRATRPRLPAGPLPLSHGVERRPPPTDPITG